LSTIGLNKLLEKYLDLKCTSKATLNKKLHRKSTALADIFNMFILMFLTA